MKTLLVFTLLLSGCAHTWRCDEQAQKKTYDSCVRPFKRVTKEVVRGCSERARNLSCR